MFSLLILYLLKIHFYLLYFNKFVSYDMFFKFFMSYIIFFNKVHMVDNDSLLLI
jgi:hypothetical protein